MKDFNTEYFSIDFFDYYIEILKSMGIKNVCEKIENMIILDYIMLNEDRHLNNFGIIRNVEDMETVDVAPIFDCGQSLAFINTYEDEIIIKSRAKYFYSTKSFDEIIKHVKNLQRIDLSKLDGIVEKYHKLLKKYQTYTNMSDSYINKVCSLLQNQIVKLNKIMQIDFLNRE